MSEHDSVFVLAAAYPSEEAAVADYEAIKLLYYAVETSHDFDAAVVAKDVSGKVRIVKKHEQPTRQGAWGGLGVGLVGGAVVALFPAVALGAGLVWLGAAGAGLGALAGHVAAGMSRSDLKEVGELLDAGQSGLLFVAATDMEARVEQAIARAKKIEKKQLKADAEAAAKEIDAASTA